MAVENPLELLEQNLFVHMLDLCKSRGVKFHLLWTSKSLAELLDIHPQTLHQMYVLGTGPKVTMLPGSRKIRYALSDVMDWLDRQPGFHSKSEMDDYKDGLLDLAV